MCLPGIVQTRIRSICLQLSSSQPAHPCRLFCSPTALGTRREKLPLPIKDRSRRTRCAACALHPAFGHLNPSGKRCVLSQIDQALRIPLTVHLGCVCVCVCVMTEEGKTSSPDLSQSSESPWLKLQSSDIGSTGLERVRSPQHRSGRGESSRQLSVSPRVPNRGGSSKPSTPRAQHSRLT